MSKFSFLVAVTLLLSLRVSVFSQNTSIDEMGFHHRASSTKLTGFDKYGVEIVVLDYRHEYKNFPYESIKNQVELRLRQGKIKTNEEMK